MSKAEKFIQEHTNTTYNYNSYAQDAIPWLTPDDARKAVEIAREEMIDKFCEWVKKNVTYIHPRKGTEECVVNLGKLKDAMRDE